MKRIFFVLFLFPLFTLAQNKQITLEDIYKKGTFRGEVIRGFASEDNSSLFNVKDIKDEKGKELAISDYMVSNDKKHIIFLSDKEAIYRHSFKAKAYLYDVVTKKAVPLTKGKVLHASFSPDNKKVAFVFENNLYLHDITTNKLEAITTDGKWNHFINGNSDWVYEEEFSFTQAYQWSYDGGYLAYYKFDERPVKEFSMTIFDDSHNKEYRYKYPKAGDSNSIITIHIYNVSAGKTVPVKYEQGDIYIPKIQWTTSDNKLVVFWMNRLQNHLKLLLADANSGTTTSFYEEKNKHYVDITGYDWKFLKDGKHFIFNSEMNGWNRLYFYSIDGKTKKELTKINYDVTEINGVDEKNGLVYYTVAYPTPMDRNFFVTGFDGRNTKQLTSGQGSHRIEMNSDFTKYYDFYSNTTTPQTVTLYNLKNNKGSVSSTKENVVGENTKLKNLLTEYAFGPSEFIRIPNRNGDTLNGWMLKPANFNASKKYPVLFVNYGGPGSQYVVNKFGMSSANRYYWEQLLAQKGFIVVNVDNTGTGYRGEEFKKKTYLELGKYETEDQVDAAKWIAKMPFVDANNIGHWGWSYGGFMSSLAITKGADVFTAAVAVAPVTSWRYYDNIYTERFMRTPQTNAKGYDENSPINHVDKIRGKYLLIHGTADDNVHFQNSAQMIKALVKANVDFETMYYPDKNHNINGTADNTTYHIYAKMTNWILKNLGNENVDKMPVGNSINADKRGF